MNMTPRERMLLILLSAVVILVGGSKLLIVPQLEKLAVLSARHSEAQFQLQQAEIDLRRAQTIDEENRTLESQIVQQSSRFFPTLTNDMVQIYFDNLARAAGVSYSSFSISPVTVSRVDNPPTPESGLTYPAGNAARRLIETTPSAESGTDTANTSAGLVEMVQVSMQLVGSYDQALALLGQISGAGRTVRVTSVNLSSLANGSVSISITAECYGVVKFAAPDSLETDTMPRPEGKKNPF